MADDKDYENTQDDSSEQCDETPPKGEPLSPPDLSRRSFDQALDAFGGQFGQERLPHAYSSDEQDMLLPEDPTASGIPSFQAASTESNEDDFGYNDQEYKSGLAVQERLNATPPPLYNTLTHEGVHATETEEEHNGMQPPSGPRGMAPITQPLTHHQFLEDHEYDQRGSLSYDYGPYSHGPPIRYPYQYPWGDAASMYATGGPSAAPFPPPHTNAMVGYHDRSIFSDGHYLFPNDYPAIICQGGTVSSNNADVKMPAIPSVPPTRHFGHFHRHSPRNLLPHSREGQPIIPYASMPPSAGHQSQGSDHSSLTAHRTSQNRYGNAAPSYNKKPPPNPTRNCLHREAKKSPSSTRRTVMTRQAASHGVDPAPAAENFRRHNANTFRAKNAQKVWNQRLQELIEFDRENGHSKLFSYDSGGVHCGFLHFS